MKISYIITAAISVLLIALLILPFNTNYNSENGSLNYSLNTDSTKKKDSEMDDKISRTEEEWKKILTPEQFDVLRKKGTERPFSGEYDKHFEKGVYKCAACNNILFESDTKFDSGCGWPSYFSPLAEDRVIYKEDKSYGMIRTEVMCANCGGHLGHVFEDGPEPTGLRYCINSVALKFEKKEH